MYFSKHFTYRITIPNVLKPIKMNIYANYKQILMKLIFKIRFLKRDKMFSFRGDAHKIYLELRNQSDVMHHEDIQETEKIKAYYETLDSEVLQLVYYRMIKEQSGMGIIPIFVTAVPWLLFLFSDKVQKVLFNNGGFLWAIFIFIYLVVLTVSTLFHFKEKAWAAFHIEIIKDILDKRSDI